MAKSKVEVPKSVAGVPVPKRLRKAGVLTSVLNHPLGRTILADVILAAAGAAATALNKHQSSAAPALQDGEAPDQAGNQSPSVTSTLAKSAAGALGHLALDVVEQVLPKKEAKEVKAKAKKKIKKSKNRTRPNNSKEQGQPDRRH